MMKVFRFLMLAAMLLPMVALAQNERNLCFVSDSIVKAYDKALDRVPFVYTQLVKDSEDYFEDLENELTGDTIWLENFENFKFYRVKAKGNLVMAEYFFGKVGKIFEKEVVQYFFLDGRLQLTKYMFYRHGEALDGVYSIYREDKRVIFSDKSDSPDYLYRDYEYASDSFDDTQVPFRQLDVRKVIYDKYLYETIGGKILEHSTDI